MWIVRLALRRPYTVAVMCGGEVIDVVNLPAPLGRPAPDAEPAPDDDLSLHAATARLERRFIVRALERAKGNRSAAARLLGIGRPLLYAKLEEHGLGARAAVVEGTEDDGGAS